MAEAYVVTVRYKKDPEHDPQHKATGECPQAAECTDVTGEHHSFLTVGESAGQVRDLWGERGRLFSAVHGFRVTRVEQANWVLP